MESKRKFFVNVFKSEGDMKYFLLVVNWFIFVVFLKKIVFVKLYLFLFKMFCCYGGFVWLCW